MMCSDPVLNVLSSRILWHIQVNWRGRRGGGEEGREEEDGKEGGRERTGRREEGREGGR